jgi:two pore calcium channel protein
MAILLTTSNFPDVMLPAYYESSFSVIFFIIYLILGLYFLLNTLLATIFTNYKKRLQARAIKREDNRLIYLEKYFNICDNDNRGYLNLKQAKSFFKIVLNLDYLEEADRNSLKKIMKIVDPAKTNIVFKSTLMDFFMMPGFMEAIKNNDN